MAKPTNKATTTRIDLMWNELIVIIIDLCNAKWCTIVWCDERRRIEDDNICTQYYLLFIFHSFCCCFYHFFVALVSSTEKQGTESWMKKIAAIATRLAPLCLSKRRVSIDSFYSSVFLVETSNNFFAFVVFVSVDKLEIENSYLH